MAALNAYVPKTPGWVAEFRAFIMRGNVVDLAVGIIIGAAFTGIVSSLVKDVFTPLIGLIVGGIDFSNIFVALNGQHYDTLDAANKAGAPVMAIGLFLNAVLNFVIVAFVIFWVVKSMSKFMARQKAADPPPPNSELLLVEIRDLLAAQTALPTVPPLSRP